MKTFYANTEKDLTLGAKQFKKLDTTDYGEVYQYLFDGLAVSLSKKHIVKHGRWTELNQEIYEYAEQFGRDDFYVNIVFTYDDDD